MYYKFLGTIAALLARAHPIAALLTGLLTPNPIRIDKLLLIGLAFAFSGYFPPAFGYFTYWGSGIVEPMIVGLIAHKCLEIALIEYVKYEKRKARRPAPTTAPYQPERFEPTQKPRDVNGFVDAPKANLYAPLQASKVQAVEHLDSGNDSAEELDDTLNSTSTTHLSPSSQLNS